jgi:hypothetical protein
MSTRLRLGKKFRELTERQTVLGSAIGAVLHGLSEGDFLELILAYANCDESAIPPGFTELLLRVLGEVYIRDERTDEQKKEIRRAEQELRRSHRNFRSALVWLCSAKDSAATAFSSQKLFQSGKLEWGRYPLIDKTSENFVRYFETHLRHFKIHLSLQEGRLLASPRICHLVDLFCACLLDRCVGRTWSEMPIKLCPTCGKLFLSERKQYCSNECQWKHYWTPERRADDKWVKDLERLARNCKPKYGRSIEDLRKKLASPKTAKRLVLIKKKAEKEIWGGWPKIVKKIDAIEKLAQSEL